MSIRQLSLTDFRNLKSTTLDFDPHFNLISGDNGSGKTSLLEAIYVLCQAQSFRTHHLKQCVSYDKGSFLLFGHFDNFKAGLSKNNKKLEIHIDGEVVKRRSELVRKAPVNIVNAGSFELIEGPPHKRRAFLDWCLFHVEPRYAQYWAQFQHALKQRNRLLKTRSDLELIDYWDQYLLEPSLQLSAMRRQYCKTIKNLLNAGADNILAGLPIELEYLQGWSQDIDLGEALRRNRERDIKTGYTGMGIHRDDLYFTSRGKSISEILSRGQGKRLCLALLLSVLKLVNAERDNRIILLIDDLHSELDKRAQGMVYQQLTEFDLQLFVSNIERVEPQGINAKESKMFHVEHGIIKPRKFS